MTDVAQILTASEAAKRLGVSTKALRLYEDRGLINPTRTAAGWRTYGPDVIAVASNIVALRALDLSLAQVEEVLNGDGRALEVALAAHQESLEIRRSDLSRIIDEVCKLRTRLTQGHSPNADTLATLTAPHRVPQVALDLPWPWGGERFEISDVRRINFIIGPLASGKTRLAHAIAETMPDAAFLGLDRLQDDARSARDSVTANATLASRVQTAMTWLIGEGATDSGALLGLLVALERETPKTLVIDMVEQALDHTTQEAVMSYLRRKGHCSKTLFLLTRSSAILDLETMNSDEGIVFCPANHSPPRHVQPIVGSPGYEAVETCLAAPEVRARTAGVIAMQSEVA